MKPTLLIVDDDEEIRNQMKWALTADDFKNYLRKTIYPQLYPIGNHTVSLAYLYSFGSPITHISIFSSIQ